MLKLKKMFLLKIMFHLDHAFQKLIKDNTEDLDTAMLMYNLLEYSQNYSMTSGKLWNYYRNKVADVDDNVSADKSFKYKRKIIGNTPERNKGDANGPPVSTLNVGVTILLKHLSNF